MESNTAKIKVALVDDHTLLRTALASLINQFDGCEVVAEANNGSELVTKISDEMIPDVVLLDLNMPTMGGLETAKWLQENHRSIHVLMLTMYDSDLALIRLLQAGVKGFIKKDVSPEELKFAIHSVIQSGFYYSQQTTGQLVNLFRKQPDNTNILGRTLLDETEIEFLKFAASELTYKEIAQQMNLSPRAVDSLRDGLFQKLSVKSRIGLAMYAIRHGIITF